MTEPDLRTNPHALPDADPPRIGRYPVNGTSLYAEVRGSGPAVLLVHAGGEDAEHWRPFAERLTGFTVVTYDRRGTLRSGRDDWPGAGSAQHADDAAGLLAALALVRRALVYEPGYLGQVPAGKALQRAASAALTTHLAAHPGDWVGAWAASREAARRAMSAMPG